MSKISPGDFFDRLSNRFDAIYDDDKKSRLSKLLDRTLRRSVRERINIAVDECDPLPGKTVIDIGCGSGRCAVALAENGAKLVLGCDLSGKMLKLALDNTGKMNLEETCRYIQTDINYFTPKIKFDYAILLGVVEYIKSPESILKKISGYTTDKIIFSVPVKWNIFTPVRKFRYMIKSCPLYFYSMKDIHRLMERCRFEKYKIIRVYRDYLVVTM